jgi:hypothetical protein
MMSVRFASEVVPTIGAETAVKDTLNQALDIIPEENALSLHKAQATAS